MIVGWDISTSAIGICFKDGTGNTEFGVIYPKGETHAEKHIDAAAQVVTFCKRRLLSGGKVTHVVEERLGGFTGGLTTKQTLMCLSAMNAVISFILSSYGTVIQIAPVTTKRIMGLVVPRGGNKKLEVIKLARAAEPGFPYAETAAGNWVRGTDDMADAWLLAEAGDRIISGKAVIGPKKKAKRPRLKTGPPTS
jgi:hypothetical protein